LLTALQAGAARKDRHSSEISALPAQNAQVFQNVSEITSTMHSPFLFNRWARRSTLLDPSSFRVEVCPPSLRQAPASAWQRLWFWLMAPAPQDTSPPVNRLPGVRREFNEVLADIQSTEADQLRQRIA
jgi:hypothetical protein